MRMINDGDYHDMMGLWNDDDDVVVQRSAYDRNAPEATRYLMFNSVRTQSATMYFYYSTYAAHLRTVPEENAFELEVLKTIQYV